MDDNKFFQDTVGKLQQKKKATEETIRKENEEMMLIIQGIASTENGEEFFRRLVRYLGIFNPQKSFSEKEMIVSRSQEMVYLNLIRPFLTLEQRKVIENE